MVDTAGFISDSQFTPDDQASTQAAQPPGFISDAEFSQKSSNAAGFIPDSQFQSDTDKYSTPGQQALTVGEGLASGLVSAPVTLLAERGLNKLGVPGLSDEDIKGRQEANPIEHGVAEATGFGAGLFTGGSEAALLANVGERLAPAALGKIGGAAFRGLVEQMGYQGGDEISKAMLGQGDPNEPVSSALAHIGAAGLMGAATGGIFGGISTGASKGLQAVENAKLGTNAQSFLSGIGAASELKNQGINLTRKEALAFSKQIAESQGIEHNPQAFANAVDLYQDGIPNLVKASGRTAADVVGGTIGGKLGGVPGAIAGYKLAEKTIAPVVENLVNKGLSKSNKYVLPAVLKVLGAGETTGLWNVLDYATKMSKGAQDITRGVDCLFQGGSQQAMEFSYKDKDKLKKYIEEGGVDQQLQNQLQGQDTSAGAAPQFAKGGHVEPVSNEVDPISTHFPEQASLLSTAKGRISGYLNSKRPLPANKLAFDKEHKDPIKEKTYDRALDIALQPLSVLHHIKEGTLQVEHMQHLIQMYPELHSHLSKKITEQIVKSQMAEEKPAYKTRIGLSLFLGAPLDSTMTPASIQAAQPQPKPQAQQQAQGKTRKGTSTLGKSNKEYQTLSQDAESDRTNRD